MEVKIQFPNERFAEHFIIWFSEIGEQSYFDEEEYAKYDPSRMPVHRFKYDFKKYTIQGLYEEGVT